MLIGEQRIRGKFLQNFKAIKIASTFMQDISDSENSNRRYPRA